MCMMMMEYVNFEGVVVMEMMLGMVMLLKYLNG